MHALFPVSPTPHVCVALYYASHCECCLFTQLTCCCLMFSRSTIGPLSPCAFHSATVAHLSTAHSESVRVRSFVPKPETHNLIRWRNGGYICLLHSWYHTSESLCDKLSEVPNKKTHLCFLWSALWSLSNEYLGDATCDSCIFLDEQWPSISELAVLSSTHACLFILAACHCLFCAVKLVYGRFRLNGHIIYKISFYYLL